MRRRIIDRVCRCMPDGAVTYLEARLLKELRSQGCDPRSMSREELQEVFSV